MSKTHARTTVSNDKKRPAGWSKKSHSNDVEPNYDVVFPIDAVNTLTITIAPDDWAAMQADMEELYGEERDREKAFAEMPEEERAAAMKQRLEDMIAAGGDNPLGAEFTRRSPRWAPATITFQGREWPHVGVRYKGASSLSPWSNGTLRLPFKFDFDEFEDDYPEVKNQRFFGFKELSLANNYEDRAGMRDTLVYEILAEAGLPSLRSAPYEIVLDYGEGPVRLGLYTLVEVVDDTGIPTYFGSDDGNIYESNGFGSTLAKEKNAEAIEASLEKKNNEDEADWSDILALYDVLHDEKRMSDPEAWRADLESIFDVDGFLEWLGIATFVGHGDTYGFAAHNFYLYNNPKTGRLTWVSWDHNVTFRQDLQPFLMLDKSNVTESWPLIRYLLDDPVYWDRYVELMAENFATVLAPDALIAKIRAHAEVSAPVATRDMSAEEYDDAVQELVDFVTARAAEVEAFLAGQPSGLSGVLNGTVTYRERIALAPDAVVEVTLEEVSRADAPATIIASQTIEPKGAQAPLAFALTYDPAQITPRDLWAVRATIKEGGQLTWTSTQRYPVITQGAPADDVEIIVQRVAKP